MFSLQIFSFMDYVWCYLFKKLLPYSISQRFSSMLSSRTFIVLYFTLNLWSILSSFLCEVYSFLHMDIQRFQHPLLKILSFPTQLPLHPCRQSVIHVIVGWLWNYLFCFINMFYNPLLAPDFFVAINLCHKVR